MTEIQSYFNYNLCYSALDQRIIPNTMYGTTGDKADNNQYPTMTVSEPQPS